MKITLHRHHIPWAMAAIRALLGPIMVLGARSGWNAFAMAGGVVVALLFDIFDGVLARRWHCDTAAVRLFDTLADTIFYLGVAIALWTSHRGVLQQNATLLATLLSLEALRLAVDLVKFRRPASYHSWLAKLWGLIMACAVVIAFATPHASLFVAIALSIGILCDLEGLAMSFVLPEWRHDIKTLRAAWRIRKNLLSTDTTMLGRTKRATIPATAFLILFAAATTQCFAANDSAIYSGGSLPLGIGVAGTLNPTAPDKLVLIFPGAPNQTTQINIPYDTVRSYAALTEVRHHLGALPAIAVGLVAARQHIRQASISYVDEQQATQVVILEVSKAQQESLVEILQARAAFCRRPAASCTAISGHFIPQRLAPSQPVATPPAR